MQTIITSRQRYATENAEDEKNEETCRDSLHHARKNVVRKKIISQNVIPTPNVMLTVGNSGGLGEIWSWVKLSCYRYSILEQETHRFEKSREDLD